MTKRRGPSAEQRGEIEMPPLDHVFPAEMGIPQQAEKVEVKQEEVPLYHEQVEESPVEQDEQELIDEVVQEEPEFAPTPVDTVSKSSKTKEENFREIRMAKERAERERDALMSQMLEMQSKLQSQQQNSQHVNQKPQVQEEEKDWYDDLDPESLVEGKQVKKIAEDLKSMKKILREQQVQAQQLAMEAKIKSQYPDFDHVFNAENINALNTNYPEVANALRIMPDDYNKATAAYTMIKNLGISKVNDVKKQSYDQEVLRAKSNAAKPRPLVSANPQQGDSPLSKANAFANGLTPDLKEQMRKEMAAARKGH